MKKQLPYLGLGALAFLVLYFSFRKEELREVVDPSMDKKSFDQSRLPFSLRPPSKISDGEVFSKVPAKRNLVGLPSKPRMDIIAGYNTW